MVRALVFYFGKHTAVSSLIGSRQVLHTYAEGLLLRGVHTKYLVGPTVYTKNYTFRYFYEQYLVLFTISPGMVSPVILRYQKPRGKKKKKQGFQAVGGKASSFETIYWYPYHTRSCQVSILLIARYRNLANDVQHYWLYLQSRYVSASPYKVCHIRHTKIFTDLLLVCE